MIKPTYFGQAVRVGSADTVRRTGHDRPGAKIFKVLSGTEKVDIHGGGQAQQGIQGLDKPDDGQDG